MSAVSLYVILLIAAYTVTGIMVAWLCLQVMMWILSFNIKRILILRKQTACDYLGKGKFWKDKNNHYVRFLKGPGMARLAKTVFGMARMEVWESNFKSNTALYEQCSVCIFMVTCSQKYLVRCSHCVINESCSLQRQKKGNSICKHFRCRKWIECD